MIQQNHPRVNCSSYKNPEMSHTCYSKDETSRGLQHVCANLSMIARLKTFHSKSECQKPFLKQQLHMHNIYVYTYIYIYIYIIISMKFHPKTTLITFFFSIFTRCDHHPLDQPNLWFFGFRGCSGSFGAPRVRLTADGMSNKTLSTFHSTDWFMGILRLALLFIIPP